MRLTLLFLLFLLSASCGQMDDRQVEEETAKVERLIEKKNYKRALKQVNLVLADYPENIDALFLKGVILEKQHQNKKAIEVYSQLLSLNENHEIARFNRAGIYYLDRKYMASYRDYDYILMTNGVGDMTVNFDDTQRSYKIPIEKVAYSKIALDKHFGFYDNIIQQTELCIYNDYKKAECFFIRGEALKSLGYDSLACMDFKLSQELGFVAPDTLVQLCW